jgi:hypothetical protein
MAPNFRNLPHHFGLAIVNLKANVILNLSIYRMQRVWREGFLHSLLNSAKDLAPYKVGIISFALLRIGILSLLFC